jgi:hypothetical protein
MLRKKRREGDRVARIAASRIGRKQHPHLPAGIEFFDRLGVRRLGVRRLGKEK